MIYSNFRGLSVSSLGLGCMRLPTIDAKDSQIDVEKSRIMIDTAIKAGVNYFDTAWGYHGGNSESVVGDILSSYPRDSYYLASKFPGYDLSNMDKIAEIFPEQLKRCRVEYFDFYLFHNVCEMNIDYYLDKKYGILDYILRQKAEGRIRHVGFSVHGNTETTKRFLDAYGEHIEFCQIQLNYVDLTYQAADEKLALLKEYGIPVWVMEPLRGGKLASLSKKYTDMLNALRPSASPVEWAFRFLQSIDGVSVVLSGMSTLEQLEDNIAIFSEKKPLCDAELSALSEIAKELSENMLPCTQCKYCVDHCPKELNIPRLIKVYSDCTFTGGKFTPPEYMKKLPKARHPRSCIGCRSCESVCPQNIKISEHLAHLADLLDDM